MYKFLILLLITHLNFAQANISFSEGGKNRLMESLGQTSSLILNIETGEGPHDPQVKKLRKQIGMFRNFIDIYIIIYPKKSKMLQLRELLDDGYELYGDYKDIFDSVKDTPEFALEFLKFKKEKKAVKKWIKQFEKAVVKKMSKWKERIASPSNGVQSYKSKDLSPFFWANNNQLDSLIPGQDEELVLQTLKSSLVEKSQPILNNLFLIETPLNSYDEENTFHDFRKSLRAILKISNWYPEYFMSLDDSYLDDVVGQFGDLNDLIVRYHKSTKDSQLKQKIKDEWQSILEKLDKERLIEQLNRLAS